MAPRYLREQRIGGRRGIRVQHEAGDGAAGGELSRRRRACWKGLHFKADASFRSGDHRQLDECAAADHDLAPERVGGGQQPIRVAHQRDLARPAQVRQPGLAIVRIRGEQGVGEDEPADVGAGDLAQLPCGDRLFRYAFAAGQARSGCHDQAASEQLDETTAVGDRGGWRGVGHGKFLRR
jgi:hypothetical protein